MGAMKSRHSRRHFLKRSLLAGTATALTAGSYAQVKGANERIRIGLIGCGNRGQGVQIPSMHRHREKANVVIAAIADPWGESRRNGSAKVTELFGAKPKTMVEHEEMLAEDGIDALIITSCDHQHARPCARLRRIVGADLLQFVVRRTHVDARRRVDTTRGRLPRRFP